MRVERLQFRGSLGPRRDLANLGHELLHERDLDRLCRILINRLADGLVVRAHLYLAQGGAMVPVEVSEGLPRYATPAFLRLQGELEVTGTFKLRKVDLQKQGFDPEACGEPVLVRDDGAGSYVPLSEDRLAEIRAGDHRL